MSNASELILELRAETLSLISRTDNFLVKEDSMEEGTRHLANLHKRKRFVAKLTEAHELVARFLNWAAAEVWPSMETFVVQLLDEWWRIQESVFCNYTRPRDETLCGQACAENLGVVTLSNAQKLFGCLIHGTLHECDAKNCLCTHADNRDWVRVCVFSRVQVETVFSAIPNVSSLFSAGVGNARFLYMRSLREFEEVAGTKAKQFVGEHSTVRRVETASRVGIEAPSTTASRAHESQMKSAVMQSSRESGNIAAAFLSDYKLRKVHEKHEAVLLSTAEKVFTDLLFDKQRRENLTAMLIKGAQTLAQTQLKRAVRTAKRAARPISAIASWAVYHRTMRRVLLVPLLEADRGWMSELKTFALRLWRLCHRTPKAIELADDTRECSDSELRQGSCTFVQMCVAMLYIMIDGMSVTTGANVHYSFTRKISLIPRDPRVAYVMPDAKHLKAMSDSAVEELTRMTSDTAIDSRSDQAFGSSKSSTRSTGRRRSNKRMHSTTHGFATNSVNKKSPEILTASGALMVRQRRAKHRGKQSKSGMRQISGVSKVGHTERDILPHYLHSSLVGKAGVYETCDVAQGRTFVQGCLRSIEPNKVELEARALRF